MIERLFGKTWKIILAILSSITLFLTTAIYFLLINSNGYNMVVFIMDKIGNNNYHHSVDDVCWSEFSI